MAPRSRPYTNMFSNPTFAILCFFCFFTSTLAASAVLGVDLGTEYIKAALVKPGIPLDIVLTKDSRRKETSAVAFKPVKNPQAGSFPERAYGSDAVALAARFPGDVYPNLKSLLGLPADNSIFKEYGTRHPALQLTTEKIRGTAAFKSGAFVPEEQAWTVEEILAMELQSIQKNAEALAGSTVKDLVITVPVFYTAEEKRAVRLAAELAGLRVLELISDGLAVGLNYATSRIFPSITDGAKPEYHLVFDMGAGSTKATILKFQGRTVKDVGKFNKTIQEVHVLGSGWDRTLGGDALNAVIVDDMLAQFVASPAAKKLEATTEAVQAHGRAAAKLWKEAERLRQILSANTNTQSSFEGLYEDVDFKYKISRADFEKLTEVHAARVGPAIQAALDMAVLTVKDLDSVILHGGAIRTPFVQKELEKIIGTADKIRSNVNADEAAVFGAGFRGAGLSPSFRVKEIKAFEGAAFAAGIKWININEKPQHQRLWQPTSFLGAEKQYSFQNQKDFTIDFYQHVASAENVRKGSAERELLALTTQNLTESVAELKTKYGCTDGDINVKLSTRLSPKDGEVEILKLIVDCEAEDSDAPNMVDSVKGLFGFGKKDQVPLSEDGKDDKSGTETGESATEPLTSPSASASPSAKGSKAKEAKKDAKAKEEKAKAPVKRFQVIPLQYTVELKGVPQLPAVEKSRIIDRIAAFDDSDLSRRKREEALNQLEGFTYKVRDLLEKESFIAASTDAERKELEAKSAAASEWIYSGGSDASREELKARLKAMKDIVTPILKRADEAETRPEQVKSLYAALNQTKSFIESVKVQIKKDEEALSSWTASKASAATASPTPIVDEFEGLEDEAATTITTAPAREETPPPPMYVQADLEAVEALYETVSKWLATNLPAQEALLPTADPVLLTKDLAAKSKQLQDKGMELVMKSMRQANIPKPKKPAAKPKKPFVKKADKKGKKAGDGETEVPPFDFDGANVFKVGEDGEMPSEEAILDAIRKSKDEKETKETKEAKEKKETKEETKETKETETKDTKHEEL